jgi:hypothetical protein
MTLTGNHASGGRETPPPSEAALSEPYSGPYVHVSLATYLDSTFPQHLASCAGACAVAPHGSADLRIISDGRSLPRG